MNVEPLHTCAHIIPYTLNKHTPVFLSFFLSTHIDRLYVSQLYTTIFHFLALTRSPFHPFVTQFSICRV